MELEILRNYFPGSTRGTVYYGGKVQCYTIEPPAVEGMLQLSCVPEGRYRLTIRYTQKLKTHFLLKNVMNDTRVLMHAGIDAANTLQDCIIPVHTITGENERAMQVHAFESLKKLVMDHVQDAPVFITIKSG